MAEARELMTCKDDVKRFLKEYKPEDILWGPKLDGVRCAARDEDYISRNGKFYRNFNCFNDGLAELEHILGIPFEFFDGEVTTTCKSFDKISGQIHRKTNVDDSFLVFKLFDICIPDTILVERLTILGDAMQKLPPQYSNISLLTQRCDPHLMKDIPTIEALRDAVIGQGYEGLVLKYKYGYYEHKRSLQWCKIKNFKTLDLRVVGRYEGKTGKNVGKLGGLLCTYKGVISNVGGGFSDEEREKWWQCPIEELPSIIEVKFQEITKANKLRFSDYVRVRDDKDEVDG